MTDIGAEVARLQALTDPELLAVIAAATAGRPGLAHVHAAATEAAGTTDVVVPAPGTPGTPGTTDVPAPPVFPDAAVADPGYTSRGVPTFDSVRERVQERFGRALGSEELDAQTPAGKTAAEQFEERQKAGHDRLEQIRQSLRGEKGDT